MLNGGHAQGGHYSYLKLLPEDSLREVPWDEPHIKGTYTLKQDSHLLQQGCVDNFPEKTVNHRAANAVKREACKIKTNERNISNSQSLLPWFKISYKFSF